MLSTTTLRSTFLADSARGEDLPRTWIGARLCGTGESCGLWDDLVGLPARDLRTHLLIIGATGSGKTIGIEHLIAQDIQTGHSFVVIDMRGDLAKNVLALCNGHVYADLIKVVDLRAGHPSHGFNPFFGAGEPHFRALGFIDAIENESESWGVQLQESMRNAALLLAGAGQPVTKLEAIFHDRSFRHSCLGTCTNEEVCAFWHRFDELSSEKQSAMASPVLNKVSLLWCTAKVASVLAHPDPINLGQHLNSPGSVTIVSLAMDELHGAARIMAGLFLRCFCREIFARVDIPESKRIPVRLYADEFSNFSGDDFESILAEGRRFKLSLVLAFQTIAQLSPKMRSMVLNNVGAKLVFRCGRDDSAHMSRDLTGDPRAFDFTTQKTGTCVLWRRGEEPFEVEISEPLIPNPEQLLEEVARFTREVVQEPVVQPHRESTTTELAIRMPASASTEGQVGTLEAWL